LLDIHVYWNILTMHGTINVKSPNNISKWQMGFNSAFKGLNYLLASSSDGCSVSASGQFKKPKDGMFSKTLRRSRTAAPWPTRSACR
jgi:hypothetical protein